MPEAFDLGAFTLAYAPLIDRQRQVVGTRLTVFPQPGTGTADAGALLAALDSVWPRPEGAAGEGAAPLQLRLRALGEPHSPAATPAGPAGARSAASATAAAPARAATSPPRLQSPLLLTIAGEDLLRAVMAAGPGAQVLLEVPAFIAADAGLAVTLVALRDRGTPLLLQGRPRAPLPAALAGCFVHRLLGAAEVGAPALAADLPGAPATGLVCDGVRSAAAAEAAFKAGALAVSGWPFDDNLPPAGARRSVPADLQVVMSLVSAVDKEAPVSQLEAILKRDPTLAFRLMRYLNSPAFGLSVEINSFGHALMLLGYQRLKRWLALLLASSSKDVNAKPLLFAAVRRGLLMEELVRQQGDAELRGELFICGVFSLLDRLLGHPMAELLASVPVPERVAQALRSEGGPHAPLLALVQAVEAAAAYDIREQAEALLIAPGELNRAVLAALAAARQLD